MHVRRAYLSIPSTCRENMSKKIENIDMSGQTTSRYLEALELLGVLKEIKVGREKLFVHLNFVRLLTRDDLLGAACGTVGSRVSDHA
jgi:hypothetical protein